jgi:hypothetical protein
MKENSLLSLTRLPGRLNVNQVAELLGFATHDIPILVRANLLKPLGNPVANATKYFASSDIVDHTGDRTWLHKATKEVYGHWAHQNHGRKPSTSINQSEQNVALN